MHKQNKVIKILKLGMIIKMIIGTNESALSLLDTYNLIAVNETSINGINSNLSKHFW